MGENINRTEVETIITDYLRTRNTLQIFFYETVYDNQDPSMLGRIRIIPGEFSSYDDMVSSVPNWDEKNDPWGSRDPGLVWPLLPYFIQQVPNINEKVQIVHENKQFKRSSNSYYLQAPFSNPMSIVHENNQSAEKNLSTGDRFKKSLSIKDTNGNYKQAYSKGVYPEPGDNSLLGRGTADLIIKENEVLLRAGKTKVIDSTKLPVANEKRAFLHLSNYTQEKELDEVTNQPSIITSSKMVKKLVIWDIMNLENSQDIFTGSVGIYNVKSSDKVKTDKFSYDTISKLSIGEDYTTPVEEFKFMGKTFNEVVELINNVIDGLVKSDIQIEGYPIKSKNNILPENSFPFIVTPSKLTFEKGFTTKLSESTNTSDINVSKNYIKFFTSIKPSGSKDSGFVLVWDNKDGKALIGQQMELKFNKIFKYKTTDNDITYGTMGAQRLYLLSHDSAGPKGKINLNETLYGIPQDKYIGGTGNVNDTIFGKTYPTVRGDKLMELLTKMFSYVTGHVHSISTLPPVPIAVGSGQSSDEINEILANSENSVLNQNIRIN